MDYPARAKEIIEIEIEGLRRLEENIDGEFQKAVELILQRLSRGGKIVISGVGKNVPISQKIAATMTSTGTPAVNLHPVEAMHGDFGMLDGRDLVLAMSYSGASEELLDLLPSIKRLGVPIIAMTGEMDSPLATHADIVLPVTVDREACPFNMAPTTSTTATLALGDALSMVLLEARGWTKEDYAKVHPGGAIGRSLLLRACDVMRTADRVAQIGETEHVSDAMLAMTNARSGSVAIVDSEGRLVGIFTDGDLRRHLLEGPDVVNKSIAEVMTSDPITLTEGQLAVDILRIFEEHSIDDLVVVDDAKHPVGLVDIQDLPKLKIL